ncbi:MAG: hypothetical protein NVS2B17_07440 [Candidatus Velthaea sp.]
MISSGQLYAYAIEPKETPAIWGGDALVKRYAKHADPAAAIGESWECWDDNRIANGQLAGETLGDVRRALAHELTGPIDSSRLFPILTKIIDARQPLSVQVHPDDAYAQRVENQPFGKTECWYILDAEPGAELVLGWTRDTNREEYARRVADGTLGEILRRVPVRAGDAFYLPAGTLHAIGAGIQLFETQQASDLTYRIFDWNRVGADGKPRQLHVEKAADVVDFHASTAGAVRQLTFTDGALERTLLIADRRFLVERIALLAPDAILQTDGLPLTLMAMETPLGVAIGERTTAVGAWSTVVTPAAAAQIALHAAPAGAHALLARPQPNLEHARAAALHAGVAPADADAFFNQFI